MSAAEVLRVGRAAGVEVAAEGGDLALNAEHEPPAEVLALLAEHKAELLELLTPPRRGPNPPAPGGLVARIIEAGGRSSIGGFRPDRTLYRTAELPEDAPAELVEHLKRERWHVARILRAARRATPRPETDPAEWTGEHEVTP